MRLSSVAPMVLAFAGAAAVAYFGAMGAVGALEANSQSEVDFRLKLEGHDWASVQADGLQVVIGGEAPSEADRFQALSVAGTVVDAARVIDTMNVFETDAVIAPRFSVEMLRNDAGISLIGLIPAATDRAAMTEILREAAGGLEVTDLLESADYDTPEGWEAALSYGVQALSDLPRSKVSVSADRVEIKAAAETAQEQARLQAELSRAAPATVVAAVSISAPRPVITPFTLRFLIDRDGPRFDVCAADTETAVDQILDAASAVGFEGKSNCRLGLGAPSGDWGTATSAGITAVGELGSGTLTLSDFDVSLIAQLGTDPDVFNAARLKLEAALPEAFTLTAVLPEAIVETEEGPPTFMATRSPEGLVQIQGHVGGDLALLAVENYAKSRFGADNAALAIEPHGSLPEGWSLRALAGLAALSELAQGTVEVGEETLSVRGLTGDQEAQTRIAQTLSRELGEGQAYSLNVTYEERLDPLANIPTPEECLAQIQAITDETKLTFEPGSSDLDAESLDTVGKIAGVLLGCPEFQILIGGHTDSQGRESMNLALSQERAEAVLTALRGERLPWLGIYPRGFGEETPIASNDTEEGREANRRIEFSLFVPEESAEADGEETNEDE